MTLNAQKTLFVTALTDVKTTDVETVGTLRWDGEKCYRWVYNSGSTDFVAGNVAFHDLSDGAAFTSYVDAAATADLCAMAGVVMGALTHGYYGWIQVLGYTAAFGVTNEKTTPTVAGASFIGINGAVYCTAGAVIGTAPLYARHIIGLDAVATVTTPAATTIKGYVQCL